jgi:hypothetical protein
LEHAHKRLRSDKEVVLAAVKNNGEAIRYAFRELQKDLDILYASVAIDRNEIASEHSA